MGAAKRVRKRRSKGPRTAAAAAYQPWHSIASRNSCNPIRYDPCRTLRSNGFQSVIRRHDYMTNLCTRCIIHDSCAWVSESEDAMICFECMCISLSLSRSLFLSLYMYIYIYIHTLIYTYTYIILYYIMLYYIISYHIILCYSILYYMACTHVCIILYASPDARGMRTPTSRSRTSIHGIKHDGVLCCVVLCCVVLCCVVLCCVVLCCVVLCCVVLCCVVMWWPPS